MRVVIRHRTEYTYAPAATRAALRLKLFPSRFASQVPLEWSVRVNEAPVDALIVNGYGDSEAIWTQNAPAAQLEVIAEGVVQVDAAAGVVRNLAEAARPPVFLRTTALTRPNAALQRLSERARRETTLASLHALSDAVRQGVVYTAGSTHAGISAGEALEQGRGVCQDQAHVFIAAARMMGVPARYVVGYLAAGAEALHETHAWAEAHVGDLGWVGFDPANAQCPTEAYVRLASGFDAADAAPIRGCISHGASETLSTYVSVDPVGVPMQSQEQ
jgi:transglutaminase-like putative cysteine protease